MTLYKDNESIASVYHSNDSTSTKKSSYPGSASFTIRMFIIRREEDVAALLGEEMGQYTANIPDSYTNAENIRKGDKVVWNDDTYIVTNVPKYNYLFKRYHILLRKT